MRPVARSAGARVAGDPDLRRAAWRLGLIAGTLVLVTAVVLGALVVALVTRSQTQALRDDLRSTAAHADDPGEAPQGIWVTFWRAGGDVDTSDGLPSVLPDEPAADRVRATGTDLWTTVVDGGRSYTVYTAPGRAGSGPERATVVQTAGDDTRDHEERERLVMALLAAGGVAVVLAAGLGAVLGRRAVRPLASALALQRRFVADASHELRTPLTHLTTRAQLARRRLDASRETPGAVAADLDGLLDDADALTGILDDMLLTVDPRTVDRRDVDVAEVARKVVAAATADAVSRGVALAVTTDPGATVEAASPVALRRAVTALVDNALDHAASNVEVVVRATAKEVSVVVSDDGPGIPPEQEGRVFARFASGRAGTGADGRRHYGLGLALVAEVAHQHGGEVHVRSPFPTELVVTLPRRR